MRKDTEFIIRLLKEEKKKHVKDEKMTGLLDVAIETLIYKFAGVWEWGDEDVEPLEVKHTGKAKGTKSCWGSVG